MLAIFGRNWLFLYDSGVNDDLTGNYFLEPTARFATIEEDEPALHPLCNEYQD